MSPTRTVIEIIYYGNITGNIAAGILVHRGFITGHVGKAISRRSFLVKLDDAPFEITRKNCLHPLSIHAIFELLEISWLYRCRYLLITFGVILLSLKLSHYWHSLRWEIIDVCSRVRYDFSFMFLIQ